MSDLRRMREKAAVFRDPDRWEDADMQRNEWLRWAARALLLAIAITVVVITVGVVLS